MASSACSEQFWNILLICRNVLKKSSLTKQNVYKGLHCLTQHNSQSMSPRMNVSFVWCVCIVFFFRIGKVTFLLVCNNKNMGLCAEIVVKYSYGELIIGL